MKARTLSRIASFAKRSMITVYPHLKHMLTVEFAIRGLKPLLNSAMRQYIVFELYDTPAFTDVNNFTAYLR